MHRDSAADLWMIPIEEVHKKVRFYGKNQWVFPQFYGSWYMQCAKNLWRTANRDELRTISGKRLIDIMASKGIMTLEQFEEHCKEVEKKFWKERFQVYNQWKFDIQRTYQLQGYIETFLGFQFKTYMGRNECTNYPAQGTAFHILLWTLINVQREMERYRMKSKLIGQIHDSMINDAVPNEVNNIIELVDLWGTKKTRETFEWISVPLKIDHELTDINDSWYLKKEVK
jgi:DNA polymerase I-like protein with 3'-5' exonuclease and polymerase domains